MIWEILFILVLILANGLFAAAEIALIAARKGRLEQRAAEGSRNAQRALGAVAQSGPVSADGPNRHHARQRSWRCLRRSSKSSSDFSGWLAAIAVAVCRSGMPMESRLAMFVACFTYVSLILGELVPKRISLHRAEGLAILVAPIMHFIAAVARPARVVHGHFDQHRFVAAADWAPTASHPCRSTTSSI